MNPKKQWRHGVWQIALLFLFLWCTGIRRIHSNKATTSRLSTWIANHLCLITIYKSQEVLSYFEFNRHIVCQHGDVCYWKQWFNLIHQVACNRFSTILLAQLMKQLRCVCSQSRSSSFLCFDLPDVRKITKSIEYERKQASIGFTGVYTSPVSLLNIFIFWYLFRFGTASSACWVWF